MFFFKGNGKGYFAAGALLKNEAGEDLNLGDFINLSPVDWNGDGIMDIAFYANGKGIQLMLGQGDQRYAPPGPLKIGDQPLHDLLDVKDGRVLFYDWNEDGIDDLLFGNGDGSVRYYQGSRTETKELRLSPGVEWLPAYTTNPPSLLDPRTMELENPRSGKRPTMTISDWNNDGKPDLLIGDVFTIQHPIRPGEGLTPLVIRASELRNKMRPLLRQAHLEALEKTDANAKGRSDLTFEQKAAYREALVESWESLGYNDLYRQWSETQSGIRTLNPIISFGYVWVYLQK